MHSFLCQTLTGDRNVACDRAKLYTCLNVGLRTRPNTFTNSCQRPRFSISPHILLISWKSQTLHNAVVSPPVWFVIDVVIVRLSLSERPSVPSIWLYLSWKMFSWKVHSHLRFSRSAILRVFWLKTVRGYHQCELASYTVSRLQTTWLSAKSGCLWVLKGS